jgi:hypothetical protein
MQKKQLLRLGVLSLAIATITSTGIYCNKNQDQTQEEQIAQQAAVINEDLQKATLNFGDLQWAEQNGTTVSNAGIQAKSNNAFAISQPIGLSKYANPAPFIAFYGAVEGNNLDGENVTISFSSSVDGKQWSGWQDGHFDADSEPSADRQVFSPIEMDKAVKYYKVKIQFADNSQAIVQSAIISSFNPRVTTAEQMAEIKAVSDEINARANPALCAKPNFTSRSTWGARAARSTPSYTTVNFLIVHHEFGSNTSSDWPARVRAVQNLHMDTNGWADVGYNYLVDPNGVAYEGRGGGENVIGAHACGRNTNTMGVCMLGNFTSVRPTNNAEYTLKRILAWKAKQRGLSVLGTGYHVDRTIYRISGHRNSCSTECPGNSLYNDLPRLRTDIQNNFVSQCQ